MAQNEVKIRITGDASKLKKALGDAGGGLSDFGEKAKRASQVGGAALAAGAVASLKSFADLESGMNEVFTLIPGMSRDAQTAMIDDVQGFSKEFGVLSSDVVPALYDSLSAGVPPGNVFEFLETAQKAAKGGVTDLGTAVDGISSVVNAYGSDVIDAATASDQMFTAVKLGKTTMDELAGSLFNVTPTSAALGVSFGDITAAMASITAQGVPTSVASTQLRQLFVELSKEGGKTAETFEEIAGKSFKQFIAEGGNTADALNLLSEYAADTGVGVNDLFGSVEAGAAALSLSGTNAEKFAENIAAMGDSAGATDEAFKTMDRGLMDRFNDLKVRGTVALEDIGQALNNVFEGDLAGAGKQLADAFGLSSEAGEQITEVLEDLKGAGEALSGFAERNLLPVFEKIGGFLKDNMQPVLAAVAVVFGAGLVAALASAGAALAAFFSPVILVTAGIAALVGGVTYAYQNFEGFRNVVDGVMSWFGDAVPAALDAVRDGFEKFTEFVGKLWGLWGDDITKVVEGAVKAVTSQLEGGFKIATGLFDFFRAVFKGDWQGMWDGLKRVFDGFVTAFTGTLGGLWQIVTGIFGGLFDSVKTIVRNGVDAVMGFIGSIPGRLWDAAVWIGTAAKGVGSSIINGIINGVTGAVSWVGDVASKIWGSVKDTINENFIDPIRNWDVPGPILGKIFSGIPRLAAGGITNGPTLAVVGDNPGGRELVAPLPRGFDAADLVGARNGGGGVTINVTALDPKGAANAVMNAIQQYERSNGTAWRN